MLSSGNLFGLPVITYFSVIDFSEKGWRPFGIIDHDYEKHL